MTKEWEQQMANRTNTVALMAATLEAGDRSKPGLTTIPEPEYYVSRASVLYETVEVALYPDR